MKQEITNPDERPGLMDLARYAVGAAKLCEDVFATTELKGVRRWAPRTFLHFQILNSLATSRSGRLSQKKLVDSPETAKSSAMSSLLDRMELGGWITRQTPVLVKRQTKAKTETNRRKKVDRRKKFVKLTPAGRRVWETIRPQFAAELGEQLRALSDADIKRIGGAFKQLQETLKPVTDEDDEDEL
jgi:hypothetical protein